MKVGVALTKSPTCLRFPSLLAGRDTTDIDKSYIDEVGLKTQGKMYLMLEKDSNLQVEFGSRWLESGRYLPYSMCTMCGRTLPQ